MNLHNPKQPSVAPVETVHVDSERDHDEISIVEDDDAGSDPYNSTGQHVTIKSRADLAD